MIIGKTIKYDLLSDAAYKFERGVDICFQDFALRRFIQIVKDHVKVKSISIQTYYNSDFKNKYVEKNYKKINQILGTNIENKEIDDILKKLGFEISDQIMIPSWRLDIESINDLAEEIARVIGYDNIPSTFLKIKHSVDNKNFDSKENLIRKYLINCGFNEIINDPFVDENLSKSISVDNPLDSNRQYLRSNIIGSLLRNLDYNEKRQKESIKFFEISDIYTKTNQVHSSRWLSIIISGRQGLNYKSFNKKLDKQFLSKVLSNLSPNNFIIKEIDRNSFNSKIKNKIYYIECCIDDINLFDFQENNQEELSFHFKKALPISEFPSSLRDISISFKSKDILEEVIDAVFQTKLKYSKDLFIFDYYNNADKNIMKVGIRFIFQSNRKTLEENEIDSEMLKVYEVLSSYKEVEVPGLNLL